MQKKRPDPDSPGSPEPKSTGESTNQSDATESADKPETPDKDGAGQGAPPNPPLDPSVVSRLVARARQLADSRAARVASKIAGALALIAAGAVGAVLYRGRPTA
jgi:hypothetical protein